MKTAYLDCRSGVAGDMLLGALVDAGWSLRRLRTVLRKIPLSGYTLGQETVTRSGIAAAKVRVETTRDAPLRRRADIRRLLNGAQLPPALRTKALQAFDLLFEAEARVHATTLRRVHLHELGAVDCLVDIVGTIAGFHELGIDTVTASAVNTGGGDVTTAHGRLAIPAPATTELLRGLPVFSDTDCHELTTPTGATLLRSLVADYGPMPEMRLEHIGHGAGSLDRPERPNIVRLLIGRRDDFPVDGVDVIETNIDDMDPRVFEHVMTRLLDEGALDVFLTPIVMKKSRPATRLSVIAAAGTIQKLSAIILAETTSFGVRIYGTGRRVLDRTTRRVQTPYGRIRIKIGRLEGRVVERMPEYEDCRRAARRHDVPLSRILSAARRAATKAAP